MGCLSCGRCHRRRQDARTTRGARGKIDPLLAEELEQAGVKLLIVSHPLERGPEGWLFFQMRGALAEYERAKLLERTQRGRIGRAKAGHPWGQVPFGYRAIREPHGGRWEVD